MSPQRERELRKAQMAAAAARRAEPDAGPAGRTAIRSKPIRITLDLSPELYRELTGWADSAAVELGVPRISLAAAVRAMIRVTADQPDPVLDRLRQDRDKLARRPTGPLQREGPVVLPAQGLGQVHAQHHLPDVAGQGPRGKQRGHDHHPERERHRPDGRLA
jgi:hypothetical protein